MYKMAKASKKGQKIWVLILYIIILLGLLAGFLIPMNFQAEDIAGSMLVMQIPDAFSKFLATFGFTLDVTGVGSALAISSQMSFIAGSLEISIDVNAWCTILYAVITVLSIICIIPAIIGCMNRKDKATRKAEKAAKKAAKAAKKAEKRGEVLEDTAAEETLTDPFDEEPPVPNNSKKKKKETTFHTAFTLEVLAAIVLFVMNLLVIVDMEYIGASACIPIAIAFAVVVVVGFIQRMIASKGSGLIKFILFLLSLIALLIAFFDISALVPSLGSMISNAFPEYGTITGGFYGGGGADSLEHLTNFVFYTHGNITSLFTDSLTTAGYAWIVGSFILGILILVNCFLDLLGIYKKTNKFMLVVNQIRYVLELAAMILCVIMVAVDTDLTFGLMLIIAAVLVVASWVINLIRLIRYKKVKETEVEEIEPDETEQGAYFVPARQEPAQTIYVSSFAEPAYAAAYSGSSYDLPEADHKTYYPHFAVINPVLDESAATTAKPSAAAQPQPAASASQPAPAADAYRVQTLYNGPVDRFISKLSNDEKVEFARVFLERSERPLYSIHEYHVGGDNTTFFSDVLIYYTAVRDLISEGLMAKIYEEDMSKV